MLTSASGWRCFILIIIALMLTSCGSVDQVQQPGLVDIDVEQHRSQIGTLLDRARESESPERDKLYLQAALLLQQIEETDWARNLFGSIDPDMLFGDDYIKYIINYSDIAMNDGAYFLAQRILTNERLEQQLQQQPATIVEQLRTRRADLFRLLGEAAKSVAERVALSNFLQGEQSVISNQDALWHTMMMIPEEELRELSDTEHNPTLKGWYTLGVISKNSDADLQMQQTRIAEWALRWPEHPASLHLPSDLQLLNQLVAEQPRQVALLLPLSGAWKNSGEAVRDGFFAAYYESKNRGTFTPTVRVYDSNVEDINQIYDLAVQQGAELIIGPLVKENLSALNLSLALPVPTLALNYVSDPFGYADNLYQFSFSREIEARNIAQRAWLEGHRNAVVIAPDSQNGKITASAFVTEWEALGANAVYISEYPSDVTDFTDIIDRAMLRTESRLRYREMRNVLGRSLEFEPRVRQDVDMIFLEAEPKYGMRIKAALDAARAESTPIYATRQIYNGVDDQQNNRIFSRMRFSTLPWYFDDTSNEKQMIENYVQPDPRYSFLYALGVDAYKIYPRLKQLESIPDLRFPGATGFLQMSIDRKIEQEMPWARMENGIAVQLPFIVSNVFID